MDSKQQRGFTTIELVLVIVIIGILSALVVTTRSGVQQNERNAERQRDIKELRNGLESYFTQANQYPTIENLNDSRWRSTQLKSIEANVFGDPSATNVSASSVLANKPAQNSYAYAVTSASGAPCGTPKDPCTQYTLTATLEGGGYYVKSNLN